MTNISHQQKLRKDLESQQIVLEDGLLMEKLKACDPMEQEEFIMLKTSCNSLECKIQSSNDQQSVMHESVVITKSMILNDKSNCCSQNIQMQKLLKTSDQVLTGNARDLCPFWKPCTKEMSIQLWSPTKTDYVDLEMSSLNGSSKRLMLNSWFSAKEMITKTPLKNSHKTYLQSLQSSLQETTGLEQDAIVVKEMKKTERKTKNLKRVQEILASETLEEKENRLKFEMQKKEKLLKTQQNKEIKKQKALEKGRVFIDRTLKKQAAKSKLIRVYFNQEQKQILKNWFGVTRFIYNKCLEIINKDNNKSLKYLREKVINNSNYETENTWMLEYNYDLRDEALSDLLKNFKSNDAKGKNYKIQFKSKKDEIIKGVSLSILAKYWNVKRGFFSHIFNKDNIRTNELLPEIMMYTSRLLKTPTNKYFISLPLPLNENQVMVEEENMLFIDPGSKTFITGYDPSGKIIIWGENDIGRIARLLHYKRKLQSKRSLETANKRIKKYRLAEQRIGEKIHNLTDDLHKKLSKWLCENYAKVYIPRLNFHKMKNLNKKEKAKLASLRHCGFLQRLINKSRESSCKVYEVFEDFTSKTCSNCGFLKKDLQGRTFICNACNKIFDRDINASKNIMLKYFTERA